MRRSTSSKSKNVVTSSALDLTGRTVEVLNTLGDVVPIVPLKTICGIALIIIDTVKDLRKLKDDNESLAARSAELAIAIGTECSANENLSEQQRQKCERLLEILKEIQALMQAQREAGRLRRFLRINEFQEAILNCSQKLDDCSRLFSTTTLMEIQRLISSEATINRQALIALTTTINSTIEQVAKSVELGQKDVRHGLDSLALQFDLVLANSKVGRSEAVIDDDGFRILRQDQITLGRSLRTLSNANIYRGKFVSDEGFVKAVVKRYNPTHQGREEFERALKFWKKNFHPNLHRLIGHSTMSTPGPFLLFPDYASLDVPGYMLKQLEAGEVASFVSTARLLHGVASGMEYIRRHCALNKVELRECLEANNMVLTPEGEVVVGHHLLKSNPAMVAEPAPENLEEFLMELFWFFGIKFTYGPKEPDLSDWKWILGRTGDKSYSHVRMLECFMMYIAGTLQDVVGELDSLIDALESLAARGELTFKNIRNAVLEVRRGGTGFWYRPPVPLNCRLGDVGYIEDGNFVVLENCVQEAFAEPASMYRSENKRDIDWVDEHGVSHYPAVPTLATVRRDSSSIVYEDVDNAKSFTGTTEDQLPPHLARARDYSMTRENGIIRHRFLRPTSATIKCLTSTERIQDLPRCWNLLIENAEKMFERHKSDGIRDIGDLLLVTKIDTDMRVSSYSWKSEDKTATPPPVVEFVEYEVPEADKPWGYWEMDDQREVTITETRCLQSIGFVQLDACDLSPSPTTNPFMTGPF